MSSEALAPGFYWYRPVPDDELWNRNSQNPPTIVYVEPWDARLGDLRVRAIGFDYLLELAELPGPFLGPLTFPKNTTP